MITSIHIITSYNAKKQIRPKESYITYNEWKKIPILSIIKTHSSNMENKIGQLAK